MWFDRRPLPPRRSSRRIDLRGTRAVRDSRINGNPDDSLYLAQHRLCLSSSLRPLIDASTGRTTRESSAVRKVLKAVAHGRKQWTSTRQSNDKCKDGEEKGRDRGSSHSRRRKDASKVELIDQGGLLGQSLLSRLYAETPAELINDNDTVEEMIFVTGSSHSGCGLEENGRGERTDEYSTYRQDYA